MERISLFITCSSLPGCTTNKPSKHLPQCKTQESHCLSLALLFQDVPLISLANIFHNAKLWNDAIIVATMAVEIAPHFVVNHFTLANVYVAMEEFEKAMKCHFRIRCEFMLTLSHTFSCRGGRGRRCQGIISK
uniref:Uncharacterized protein n=1 Tax=Buteo japonicus TaxID=224669 RepID=A0A8C0HRD9_9AVES